MDLFVEKEFVENFEIEYDPERKSDIQQIIYAIFSQYTKVHLFTNAPIQFVAESELLSRLTDNNTTNTFDIQFNEYFINNYIPKTQTLVLTGKSEKWFPSLIKVGVLCFSYDSYESGIRSFIKESHFRIDLSESEIFPFDWSVFKYLHNSRRFIIIVDPYILNDSSNQKIQNNLVPLIKKNLNKDEEFKIFIITEVDDNVGKHIQLLYRELAEYKIKIYVFNRIKGLESIEMHDRLLYTSYVLTGSGKGFNLNLKKPINSEIVSESFFAKHTYKRLINHFDMLKAYILKLEKYQHFEKPFIVNNNKAYEEFMNI